MKAPRGAICWFTLLVGCSPASRAPLPAPPPRAEAAPAAAVADKRPVDAARYRLELPAAVRSLRELPVDGPNVIVSDQKVWVDDQPAGTLSEVIETGRLMRIAALFDILKAKRDAWKQSHPDELHPGAVVLWFDRSTRLTVFKSVFQTAAFAGYPKLALAVTPVGREGSGVGYVSFGARVPLPGNQPPAGVVLHIDYLISADIQLAWKVGSSVERLTTLNDEAGPAKGRLALLSERMVAEWQQFGGHQTLHDEELDQAVLHVPNELDLATAVRLMDAIYAPQRQFLVDGKSMLVPAFNVTFAIN
jgi:hypothetical protein